MIVAVITLFATLLFAAAVHEASHALALRTLGMSIAEAGLGLSFPPRWTLPPRGRRRFALTLTPWLLGAYVKPHEHDHERLEALPYRDQAWFLNVGIVANLILGFGLLAIRNVAVGRLRHAVVFAGLTAVCWFARRIVAAYVAPALAIPLLVFVGWAFSLTWARGKTGAGFAEAIELVPSGALEIVLFAGIVSIALAILNALPLFGLDNGKVVDVLLWRWRVNPRIITAYRLVGSVLVAASLALAIGSDAWAVLTRVFSD